MKKIILISFLALTSLVSMAQDNYREAVKTFIEQSSSNVDLSNVPAGLIDELYDITAEEFQANGVTIEEINTYTAKVTKTKEGQAYLEHAKQIQSKEAQERLQNVLMPSLMPLFTGGEVKAIEAPEVPAEYQKKYHEFYVATNAGSQFDTVFGALEGMLKSQPGAEETIGRVKTFFAENGENMLLTISEGVFTEADLDFAISLANSEEGKHINEASKDIAPKFMKVVMQKFGGLGM